MNSISNDNQTKHKAAQFPIAQRKEPIRREKRVGSINQKVEHSGVKREIKPIPKRARRNSGVDYLPSNYEEATSPDRSFWWISLVESYNHKDAK